MMPEAFALWGEIERLAKTKLFMYVEFICFYIIEKGPYAKRLGVIVALII